MSSLIVKPVETREEKKQFLQLPWKLYDGDPYWIPPLRSNQVELIGFKHHPFHDTADVQTFLALRGGQPVGRIAAIVNHAHNRRFEERRGFFGFFETIDDLQVASALFDSSREWLAQKDMTAIRGPMNPSINYEIGLLVDGFDSSPTFMMTYNPPYYQTLIEDCGFEKSQDLYAYWGHREMVDTLDKKMDFIVEEVAKRFDVKLRRMSRWRFKKDVKIFLHIYNEANAGMWGFVPLSEAEVAHMSSVLRFLICPQMTTIAEVDGRPVGAVFGMLDYNPRIKQIDGRLFPFGFLRLLWNRRAIKRVRIVATEVLPEFQRWGLGLSLMSRILPDA
ncbi:MAG TPA: N-acetyltransferase, partial [Pirellulales bacterium]|nr:N-acetyltransferase [Pirellulales bacterium]